MLDMEEQERLDRLKVWWQQHGRTVIVGLVLLAALIASAAGWRYYQQQQLAQASALDLALQEAYATGNTAQIKSLGGQLIEKYERTPYAVRAALGLAQVNYDNGDSKSAKAQLEWALEHGKGQGLSDLIRLRLAAILAEEKAFDAALKLVATPDSPAFAALYSDLRGDIAFAQGDAAKARQAWQEALASTDKKSNYRQVIQMKLDDLG